MTRQVVRWLALAGAASLAAPALADIEADARRCLAADRPAAVEPCNGALAELLAEPRRVIRLADELVATKAYGPAVRLLDLAAERHPGDEGLKSRLAIARSYAEEAAWMARRADGRPAPATGEVGASLARIRCTRLSGAEALAACDEALGAQPGDAALLAARGDLLAAAGRTGDAAAAYAEALRTRPGDAMLRQKFVLMGGSPEPRPAAPAKLAAAAPTDDLDQRLATLERLRVRKLVDEAEYGRRRRALLDTYLGVAPVAPVAPAALPTAQAVDFGRYHALVIGIDAYRHLPKLETAGNDARAVAAMLKDHYDFQVRLLLDASREQIVEALDEYREKLSAGDNLLIYYAGHGWLDKEADQGFWLPVDSRAERRSQWLSNDTVRDAAKAMKAKHLLVVADSCFSGTLTRGFTVPPTRDVEYLKRIAGKRARQALSSGGLEPVADSSGGGHSPFAQALVNILGSNTGVMDGTTLFGELRRPVAVNAEQTPEFADIRRAGHDGGDFLFVRRR